MANNVCWKMVHNEFLSVYWFARTRLCTSNEEFVDFCFYIQTEVFARCNTTTQEKTNVSCKRLATIFDFFVCLHFRSIALIIVVNHINNKA